MRRKSPDNGCTSLVAFRLSASEHERLERLARSSDRTVSQLMRLVARRVLVNPGADVLISQGEN